MTESDLLYLDCYLELDAAALETARGLNRQIVESLGGSVDFSRGTIPHITLFMGLFPACKQPAITAAISAIARTVPPFAVRLEGLSVSREGYLFWQVLSSRDGDQPEPAIQALHRALVEALNPLRGGAIRPKFLETLDQYDIVEQENIRAYGFPWVLGNFSPHITIGAVSPDLLDRLPSGFQPPAHVFQAETLGLGAVGGSGVVFAGGNRFPLGTEGSPRLREPLSAGPASRRDPAR